MIAFPVVRAADGYCYTTIRPRPLNHFVFVSTQTRSYIAEIKQLQSALYDEYNNFSGNINPIPHLRTQK